MILDDAISARESSLMFPKREFKAMQDLRHKARRFVFDEDASAKAGRFATECADLVCENAQFALTPFPNTYIELDFLASIRASSQAEITPDTAKRIGFLFGDGGEVTVCTGGDYQTTHFLPFRYHHKGTEEPERLLPNYTQFLQDFLVGEVAPHLRKRVDVFAHRLTDIWDVSLTVPLPPHIFQVIEQECRGQLKRALAALLLLNQKQSVQVRELPPSRKLSGGKLRTYMAHSVVSIDLGQTTIRRSFHVDHRSSPRRHEVRGHFVHYGIEEHCSHEWETYATEETRKRDLDRVGKPVLRWRCASCGGLRVRRETFDRGDATKGFVTKTYDVKG